MIDTINEGTLYLRGPVRIGTSILCEERVHANKQICCCSRSSFTLILNTEADEGQLQHMKLCLLSSKTNCAVLKWFEAHVQQYSS